MNQADTDRSCLGCDGKTKSVGPETVTSLVLLRKQQDNDGFRFCPAQSCEVVYSRRATNTRVNKHELDVEVFQKSANRDRLVCYCFDYSVRDVEADGPAAIDDIEVKCREGLDRCEELNPQGRCCLGNVRQVANKAGEGMRSSDGEQAAAGYCCASVHVSEAPPAAAKPESAQVPPRAGRWATGGAIVAAVLSSACCWLPLSLIALGISAGGVGAFFEAYRMTFLGATGVLLGTGFYFVYVRKPTCEPGDACAVPNPSLQRFNKIMLWVATALVAGFALFPNYIGYLLGSGEQPTAEAATPVAAAAATKPDVVTRTYAVEGMSCEGCTIHIKDALEKLAIVSSATIVYEEKIARVTFTPGAKPDDAAVIAAIDETGFEATLKAGGEK